MVIKMITVGVVIPTLSNLEGAYKALHSIKGAHSIFWMPIILDNWRENRSVSQSWNYGLEIANDYKCDYALVINDDVLFSPWTLAGLVNTMINSPSEDILMVTGLNMRGHLENAEDIFNIEIPSYKTHDYADHPDFACFMVKPDIIDIVGQFDENFTPAYFEDNDYHYRIQLLGYRAIFSSWAPYWHFGSQTQNANINSNTLGVGHEGVVSPNKFVENREYYVHKWGGEPGRETYIHPYNDESMKATQWKLLT